MSRSIEILPADYRLTGSIMHEHDGVHRVIGWSVDAGVGCIDIEMLDVQTCCTTAVRFIGGQFVKITYIDPPIEESNG